NGYADAVTSAAIQHVERRKRLTGVAPRAIWAALWIQSSWGGKPQRSQRSQSPQVKPDLRGHRDMRAILLGNTRRMMSSVRITVLHGFVCRIIRRLSSAALIEIKSNGAAVKSFKQRGLFETA